MSLIFIGWDGLNYGGGRDDDLGTLSLYYICNVKIKAKNECLRNELKRTKSNYYSLRSKLLFV